MNCADCVESVDGSPTSTCCGQCLEEKNAVEQAPQDEPGQDAMELFATIRAYVEGCPRKSITDKKARHEALNALAMLRPRLSRPADAALRAERDAAIDAYNRRTTEALAIREALTPSAETKAAYIGEFSWRATAYDEDGNEVKVERIVPWSTIKEIMAAIRNRAALASSPREDDKEVNKWEH